MKTAIILIIIAGAVCGLWYWASSGTSVLDEAGTLGQAEWGRVEMPVSASGEAHERQRVEIKAEASGSVVEIPVQEGDIVQPDQLLIRLDTEEEQRNVDRAQAALDQAVEDVALAEIALEQARADAPLNIENAEVARDIAQATYDLMESEYNYYKDFAEGGIGNEREELRAKEAYLRAKSQLQRARNDLKLAIDNGPRAIRRAEHQRKAAIARRRSTEYALSDAQRRLRKTNVKNNYPAPCRVVRIYTSTGQVVSSAVSVVGGGTPLMELADVSAMEVVARVDEADISKVVSMMNEGRAQRRPLQATAEARSPGSGPSDARWEGTRPEDPPPPAPDAPPEYRDEVQVTFDALPRRMFTGRILEIAQEPTNVANIPTFDVRIRLHDDPDVEHVRLGMQCTVEFAPVAEEGLRVPYEAVHKLGRDHYVVKMPDPASPLGDPIDRDVDVGLTDGSKVIINRGITEEDRFYIKVPRRIGRKE